MAMFAGPVAFLVALMSTFTGSGRVPFDVIITNIGGDYDQTSHLFRCPSDRVYMFSATMGTSSSIIGILEWNGGEVFMLAEGENQSASQTVMCACLQNDIVPVESLGVSVRGALLSSFSGVQLLDFI